VADAKDSATSTAGGDPAGPPGCDVRWPYRADPPQRLKRQDGTFDLYVKSGGLARPHSDVRGFLAAEPGNSGDMARFYFFCLILDQIAKEGVTGDLLELGAYKGGTASVLATMARKLDRTLFVLDTFEGFAAVDLKGIDADKRPEFADTSLEAVRALVGKQNVRFVKGYFPASAASLPADARYALVHIDCDLYAPILSALDYFYPRMTPGGFIIVHDYSSLHWNGAERAVDEFFADKPECVVPLTDGAGSVVVRRLRSGAAGIAAEAPGLPIGAWVPAAHGRLAAWLGSGWSAAEEWGVWGVGPTHELLLPSPEGPPRDLLFSLEVHGALLGARTTQIADVIVAGESIETWVFTQVDNRATRAACVPARLVAESVARAKAPIIRVELRPRDLTMPRELDPTTPERRPLGLALHRAMVAETR
jgi:Macrocin-O-methyltransferase (TylF)